MSARRFIVAMFVFTLAIGCPAAFAQPKDAHREDRLKAWLKKYPDADANKDGKLTLEEARKYRDEVLKKRQPRAERNRVRPTHADVKYGPHKRNVFDLWLPESKQPDSGPLSIYVYFHGGGFVAGDKAGFDPSVFLDAGMAVVSGNYRFVDGVSTLSPIPMLDAARVIQYLRHRAKDWNLNSDRIAVFAERI